MDAYCNTCESSQEVEVVKGGAEEGMVMCLACGDEFVPTSSSGCGGGGTKYANYTIGEVLSVEEIPKQKLKKVLVLTTPDGSEDTAVQVVTNAKYIEAGWRVVVATEGAVVPAGAVAEEDPDAIVVKSSVVGGVRSRGMLCDCHMLGWAGGAKGVVQQIPNDPELPIGVQPPAARPRA